MTEFTRPILRQCPLTCGLQTRMTEYGFSKACAARLERVKKLAEVASSDPHAAWCRECKGQKRPAELEIITKEEMIMESTAVVVTVVPPYKMPPSLAKVLRPMAQAEAETATIAGLAKFWRRPLIKYNAKSACPCCGGVHRLKNGGICSGCNSDKVAKLSLSGLQLLAHLARRAEGRQATMVEYLLPGQIVSKFFDEKCTLSGPRTVPIDTLYSAFSLWCEGGKLPPPSLRAFDQMVMGGGEQGASWPVKKERREGRFHYRGISLKSTPKKSTSPAPESSSPAATPLAGAGLVESQLLVLKAIHLSLGLNPLEPLSEIPKHIDKLIAQRDLLETEVGEVSRALCTTNFANIAQVAARCMAEATEGVQAKAKVAALTEEVATLNRLLATQPMETPAVTEESIVAKWSALPVPDGYEALTDVLHEAIDQAAHGKGLERHADDRPFHDQPIMRETQAVGLGYPAGQARKKILEAVRCCDDHPERSIADLLGAINYTAALVIAIRAAMVEQAA